MGITVQEKFWESEFGKDYTERNNYTDPAVLDTFYTEQWGVTRTAMNQEFLNGLSLGPILEVGCNVGNQLNMLQSQGHTSLYGIELQPYAVERAKALTHDLNIIQGSAFDLPFKDNYFDVVFTAGVLIHINPVDLPKAMAEMYRVSKKYIWGFEYFSSEVTAINYRDNTDKLWKADYAKLFQAQFPDLKLVKQKEYPYTTGTNVDVMYLLEKS